MRERARLLEVLVRNELDLAAPVATHKGRAQRKALAITGPVLCRALRIARAKRVELQLPRKCEEGGTLPDCARSHPRTAGTNSRQQDCKIVADAARFEPAADDHTMFVASSIGAQVANNGSCFRLG